MPKFEILTGRRNDDGGFNVKQGKTIIGTFEEVMKLKIVEFTELELKDIKLLFYSVYLKVRRSWHNSYTETEQSTTLFVTIRKIHL